VAGWIAAIARFGVDAVGRAAHAKSHAAACVSAQRAGCAAGQRLAGAHNSTGAVESPPQPCLRAWRAKACNRDRLRKMGIADIQAAATDEIGPEELSAQLETVVPGHNVEIGIGIEVAVLQCRP